MIIPGPVPQEVGSRDAAVHEKVASGDESSFRTHQERANGADLIRRPSASGRR